MQQQPPHASALTLWQRALHRVHPTMRQAHWLGMLEPPLKAGMPALELRDARQNAPPRGDARSTAGHFPLQQERRGSGAGSPPAAATTAAVVAVGAEVAEERLGTLGACRGKYPPPLLPRPGVALRLRLLWLLLVLERQLGLLSDLLEKLQP